MIEFIESNWAALLPIATFILGFLVSRLTMTKKEKSDVAQKIFENSRDLMIAQQERYQEFTAVFQKYINKSGSPDLNDFLSIATVGEKYFYQLKIISDAILSGKVDKESRDNTLVPRIVECINGNLPTYYETLRKIARRSGFPYSGELKRENYLSLYRVAEKYGNLPQART
ncbi:hypothetical protein [Bauldia litoralis]|uniref:hypothetical protein n=1 Tax=Bauldia litoralis TaxID=665467 RepID=UPI003265DD17